MSAIFAALAMAQQIAPLVVEPLPPNTDVLAAPEAGFQLPVCSRTVAGPVEGGWDIADADVLAMEDALAAIFFDLAYRDGYTPGTERPDPLTYTPGDDRWRREVFGIVRNGRRIVYGNYLPADVGTDAARRPTAVCDGGPVFFGVEFDVASGAITHIAFNGSLGGPFWPDYPAAP